MKAFRPRRPLSVSMPVLPALLLFAAALGLSPSQAPESAVSQARVAAHLRFLAADELRGRKTGTLEHDIAARYIAEQFRASGVEPAASGSFFQPIPLEQVSLPEHSKLQIGSREFQPVRDFLILGGGAFDRPAPVMVIPDSHSIPLTGEAAGKILLVRRSSLGGMSGKVEAARKAGALALIETYPRWDVVASYLRRPRMRLHLPGEEPGDEDGLPYLVMRTPEAEWLDRLQATGEAAKLASSGVRVTSVKAANVIGRILGSDAALRAETVVLMAHYDHLGAEPDSPFATPEDSIFNGARDNGMGVVALLTAAEMLAARPPARSILLLAVSAEEEGLLGSNHYVRNPVTPLRDTVFVLNVDGGGFSDTDVATVIGLDRTSAGPLIRSAAAAQGLDAIPGPEEAQNFFDRSDNAVFARLGVPAPTFSPGFRTLDGPVMDHYHRPSDEAGDDFDYAYLLRFCRAFAAAARAVADSPARPRWVEGDAYAEAAAQLYGSSRP